MAFKDTWVDKINGVDGVLAEDINSIEVGWKWQRMDKDK